MIEGGFAESSLLLRLDMGSFTWRKTKRFGELRKATIAWQISNLHLVPADILRVPLGLLETHLPSG